jgi:hypothetical protein
MPPCGMIRPPGHPWGEGTPGLFQSQEETRMHATRTAAVFAALAFTLAAGTAEAASQKSRRSANANPQDNMADQLNAQSLSRAQAGTDSPMPAVDSTGNLNRMSQGDAAKGKSMSQPPMPFR